MRITSARYWRGHSLVKKIYLAASLLVLMPLLFTLRYIVLEPAVVSIPPAVVSIPPDLQRVLSGLSPDTQQYILQYKNICETQSTQPNRVLLELREQRVGTNQSLHTLLQSFFTGPSNHPTNMAPHTVADTKVHASPTFASRACPCLPLEKAPCSTDSLYKYMRLTWTNIEVLNTDVHVGGEWMPTHCAPRQRIAIIIPYRSREQHLKVFMATMHPFLQRQHLHYQLFVIEQHAPAIFNRASLLNVGFLEARKHGAFDCYIYHDVDLLPESDLNLYTCFKTPLHIGAYMNKFEYRMPYNNFFGGAMALTGPQMELINGFPNNFYGWGGEDDDIYERVMFHNLTVEKHPLEIGKTYMLKHNHDRLNPENPLRFNFIKKINRADGLSGLSYRQHTTKEKLYTHVHANLDPPLDRSCVIDQSGDLADPANYLDCYHENNFVDGLLSCCPSNRTVYCCNTQDSPRLYRMLLLCMTLSLLLLVAVLYVSRGALRQQLVSYYTRQQPPLSYGTQRPPLFYYNQRPLHAFNATS